MARARRGSPASSGETAESSVQDLVAEIAKLKKELAALKKQCDACCNAQSKGGADPRVDKIFEAFEKMGKAKLLK